MKVISDVINFRIEKFSNDMYGLIGHPLSHSFSKDFFTKKFADEQITGVDYRNFPLPDISDFPHLVESNSQLLGLNVTIPYKEKIIPFLDRIDSIAEEIGAVNTIKFDIVGGKRILTGFNTDAFGFKKSLQEILPINRKISNAFILGTGGASKAVAYTFKQLGISYLFVSSSEKSELTYKNITGDIIRNSELIINTSPLGMFPNESECPDIPYSYLNESHILFDLIYNPAQTLFLKKGLAQGATVSNGLKMLEYQALKSWEIWNQD